MTQTTVRSEYAAAAAANVAAAREVLATTGTARTREANHALCDLAMFDEQIKRGQLATFAGELHTHLSLSGLSNATFTGEDVDDVRDALRAYGQWLIQVADVAR